MKEQELAKKLIKDANEFYKLDKTAGRPTTIIDKQKYKKYNIELLKQELEKENFTISEFKDAPEPICQFPLETRKFIIYKK